MKEHKTQRSPRESHSGKCAKTAPKTQNGTDPLGFLAGAQKHPVLRSKERGTSSGTVLPAEGDHRGFHPLAVRSRRGLYLQRAQAAKRSCVAS